MLDRRNDRISEHQHHGHVCRIRYLRRSQQDQPANSARSVTLDGTINTSAPVGLPGASNGSLYFYTPGGFVLGANARINVGSLVLSASPIVVDGSGNFISGFGTTNHVVFGQAAAGAAIVTNAGSQINASAGDAYVALVAPSITHNGAITVNGSAALSRRKRRRSTFPATGCSTSMWIRNHECHRDRHGRRYRRVGQHRKR